MNSVMKGAVAASIFAGVLGMGTSQAANLVVHGDFNLCSGTTCSPWVFTPAASGSNFVYANNSLFGPLYGASFQATGAFDDEISQTLATGPGTYTISFEAVSGANTSDVLSAWFGATELVSFVDDLPNLAAIYTFTETAIGPTTIAFFGRAFPFGDQVTNVSVTEVAATTPLPAGLPLFATGLGGLGLLGWRRKRKAQA